MASKLSPDGTTARYNSEHSELAVLTALATFFYTKMPCINFGEALHDVS